MPKLESRSRWASTVPSSSLDRKSCAIPPRAFAGAPHESKLADSRFSGKRLSPRVMVKPVKGKAILWANMRGDDWHESEPGSSHTALPVLRGIKWAATIWVHANGFRIPEQYAGRECSIRYAREQL